MKKSLIAALLLLAVSVIIMIMNRYSVNLNVFGYGVSMMQSFVLLIFTGVGVVVGICLK